MAKISPLKFMQEVRQEAAKITWPSRRETFITTIMVFVMVFLAGIFFFFVDQIIRWAVAHVLGTRRVTACSFGPLGVSVGRDVVMQWRN